jgi:hypothetical protein
MSVLKINPFEYFTDTNGDPLDAGYVYVGVANLDPITNPIAIYSDAAMTIPIAQPIRTINGYLDASGTPAVIYADGDYSVKVLNRNSVQIYYEPSILAIGSSILSNSLFVSYKQSATAVTRSQDSVNQQWVSVRDFGAVGDGVTDDSAAFVAAIAYMNATYTGLDGFLRDPPKKGILYVPISAGGAYIVTQQFLSTGNYGVVIDGTIRYTGVAGTIGAPVTVWTIGREIAFDFIADLDFKIGMYTTLPLTTSYITAFKLKNMVDCRIWTTKLRGFNTAMMCLAKGESNGGWYGNTVRIGTFDTNMVDIEVRSENFGSPNGSRFYDGFFYKTNNATFAQNCFKFTSDGLYNSCDSNLVDGCNFEGGKGTGAGIIDAVPINLEVGTLNKFTNLRVENASNSCLASVTNLGNVIQTRAIFVPIGSASTEIVSPNLQHTGVIPQADMFKVYDSGYLPREVVKLQTSGRLWSRSVTFNDTGVTGINTSLSTASLPLFDLTTGGIKLAQNRAMLSFKIKCNGDRRFLLRTFVENAAKKVNTVIACFDAAGTRLGDDAGIAVGTWGVSRYVKSNINVPMVYSANQPWTSTGGYITPITTFQTRLGFEVHPNVASIEVYYSYANSGVDDDIVISRYELYSVLGQAGVLDACAPTPTTGDRWLYQPYRAAVAFSLTGSGVYNPPNLTAGTNVITTLAVAGSALGDIVSPSFSLDLQGIELSAWVSVAGTVSIKFNNTTAGAIDLASGTISLLLNRLTF